eukprot:GHVP01068040.1.p1 GENE.GHVP01068040.1~~GHVP01068040.1.p1  ORF type:complete len:412 (-),score=93.08 GHVP01068040.1:116-1273(-)
MRASSTRRSESPRSYSSRYAEIIGAATFIIVSVGGVVWWRRQSTSSTEMPKKKNMESESKKKSKKKTNLPKIFLLEAPPQDIKHQKDVGIHRKLNINSNKAIEELSAEIDAKDFESKGETIEEMQKKEISYDDDDLSSAPKKMVEPNSSSTEKSFDKNELPLLITKDKDEPKKDEPKKDKPKKDEPDDWNLKFDTKSYKWIISENGHLFDVQVGKQTWKNQDIGFRIDPSVWDGEKICLVNPDLYKNDETDDSINPGGYQSYKGLIPTLAEILRNSPRLSSKKVNVLCTDKKTQKDSLMRFIYLCPQRYNLAPVVLAVCRSLEARNIAVGQQFTVVHRILLKLGVDLGTNLNFFYPYETCEIDGSFIPRISISLGDLKNVAFFND